MNKQEVIEKIETCKSPFISEDDTVFNYGLDKALSIIKQLDEPEKLVVPQFVADWYEEIKGEFYLNLHYLSWDLFESLDENACVPPKKALVADLIHWYRKNENAITTLVNMHKFGYEVKKEKLYTVEIPNPNRPDIATFLYKENGKVFIGTDIFLDEVPNYKWKNEPENQLTESEIKQDFDWAWQFAKEVEK